MHEHTHTGIYTPTHILQQSEKKLDSRIEFCFFFALAPNLASNLMQLDLVPAVFVPEGS